MRKFVFCLLVILVIFALAFYNASQAKGHTIDPHGEVTHEYNGLITWLFDHIKEDYSTTVQSSGELSDRVFFEDGSWRYDGLSGCIRNYPCDSGEFQNQWGERHMQTAVGYNFRIIPDCEREVYQFEYSAYPARDYSILSFAGITKNLGGLELRIIRYDMQLSFMPLVIK